MTFFGFSKYHWFVFPLGRVYIFEKIWYLDLKKYPLPSISEIIKTFPVSFIYRNDISCNSTIRLTIGLGDR